MPTKEEEIPKEIYINNNLPILYVDDVDTRHRQDGLNYLSFTTNIPDQVVEQVRLMIDDESLHRIIDDICRNINYYPERPSKTQKGSSE
ncbi:MAG TPA: hypothetical protein G4N93_05380 [Dehalococcoidia bacterium]|nr:hypothetical protein [Dehalococcoidia bacterium]